MFNKVPKILNLSFLLNYSVIGFISNASLVKQSWHKFIYDVRFTLTPPRLRVSLMFS